MFKIQITLDSYTLLRPVDVLIAMPYGILAQAKQPKIIWALHTAINGAAMFFDDLCAASYVDKMNCIIIAPNLGNGFFINSKVEQQADFLRLELLPSLQNTLNISKDREDNVILGISAGAYGAINWIKSTPQSFAKAALISGCYSYNNINEPIKKLNLSREQYAIHQLIYKKILPRLADTHNFPTDDDMTQILPVGEEVKNYPELTLFCGEDDNLAKPSTLIFYDKCKYLGLNISLNMSEGGHNNAYWVKVFPDSMNWLIK